MKNICFILLLITFTSCRQEEYLGHWALSSTNVDQVRYVELTLTDSEICFFYEDAQNYCKPYKKGGEFLAVKLESNMDSLYFNVQNKDKLKLTIRDSFYYDFYRVNSSTIKDIDTLFAYRKFYFKANHLDLDDSLELTRLKDDMFNTFRVTPVFLEEAPVKKTKKKNRG